VQPVEPSSAERPTWSVMIPVHNCAALLEHALGEVVAQLGDRDDAEIVVVDDMSTDNPKEVVERLGGDAVRYVALSEPHGAIRNFNACVGLSRGRLVHLLHGDDGVLPGFYEAMETPLLAGGAAAGVCRTRYVDDRGEPTVTTRSETSPSGWWNDAQATLAVSNRVRPAGIVVARDTYEAIGGYRTDLPHAADWDMWVRIAAHGPIWFVDEVLSLYRVHDGSDTTERMRTGENIKERIEAIDIVAASTPPEIRSRARRQALGYAAVYAMRTGLRRARRRDLAAAFAQCRAATSCVWAVARPGRS
jgi:glycosyltransferase involved in cell wall biosynthesis